MNILEILKKCPIGTKLYSPICGECKLHNILLDDTFSVISSEEKIFVFFDDGRYIKEGECCIFPSKENRDWNEFEKPTSYKNGDIVYANYDYGTRHLFIVKEQVGINKILCHIGFNCRGTVYFSENNMTISGPATPEDKEILFEQIENNGYKWNEQTKTLEKLIKDKFDISTLIPFESKVLVRNDETCVWKPAIFGCYIDDCLRNHKFLIMGPVFYKYLIPYKNNEHLLGKTNDCDNYYKTW
jgi:hypothetical protein